VENNPAAGDTDMQCQYCNAQATIHLTDIVHKKKRETHLCEECARKQQLIPEGQKEIHIPALLQFLLGQTNQNKGEKADPGPEECSDCGTKYSQFRSEGRLGCPHDYDVFRIRLQPLLMRIHRSQRHLGKVPARIHTEQHKLQLQTMRDELQKAILEERYEDAARLRDAIRSKEQSDET
jgi:protein arginine kinase activator